MYCKLRFGVNSLTTSSSVEKHAANNVSVPTAMESDQLYCMQQKNTDRCSSLVGMYYAREPNVAVHVCYIIIYKINFAN